MGKDNNLLVYNVLVNDVIDNKGIAIVRDDTEMFCIYIEVDPIIYGIFYDRVEQYIS